MILKELDFLMRESPHHSPTIGQVYAKLGNKFVDKVASKNQNFDQRYTQVWQNYLEWFQDPKCESSLRDAFLRFEGQHYFEMDPLDWPKYLKYEIGKILFRLLESLSIDMLPDHSAVIENFGLKVNFNDELQIKTATKSSNKVSVPVLYTVVRLRKDRQQFELKPHPILSKLFELHFSKEFKFDVEDLPMLIPPLPWSSTHRGGFLLKNITFCRLPTNDLSDKELNDWSKKCDVAYPIFDSLNLLGKHAT